MLSHRFLLSLVAALLLSSLASANSTNVAAAYLHSGAYNSANYAGHFSTNVGKTTATMFVAQPRHISTFAIGDAHAGAAVSGKVTYGGGILFPERRYGPICCEARNWVGAGRGSGPSEPRLSTPEPSTLMLLSTGLMGIAGMVRRKLLRG